MTLQGRATGSAYVALALGILAPPPPLLGQSGTVRAEIVGIVVDSESFDSSTDVRISRFEDFSEEERIDVGTTLAVGDMLTSLTGSIGIELSCGEETTLRFADRFKVLINTPEEADCALNFLGGSLDVIVFGGFFYVNGKHFV